jgi:hypothetical protein
VLNDGSFIRGFTISESSFADSSVLRVVSGGRITSSLTGGDGAALEASVDLG